MIQQFWETEEFYPQFNKGVLKLFKKKADKRRIRDWCPIAMLSTTYKIISKIIGNRLRNLLPKQVSS